MGRGFGRGAKAVAIVTHAQVGTAGKKTPKGLRSVRQKKRQRLQPQRVEELQLEQSLGVTKQPVVNTPRSLTQQIAGIQFQHVVNKRQKGLKQLRRQIISAVKDVRRRHADKKRATIEKAARRSLTRKEKE